MRTPIPAFVPQKSENRTPFMRRNLIYVRAALQATPGNITLLFSPLMLPGSARGISEGAASTGSSAGCILSEGEPGVQIFNAPKKI